MGVNVDYGDTVVIDYWDTRFLRITLRKQKKCAYPFLPELGILSFAHLLRLLRSNEGLWAIAQEKWATVSKSLFFLENCSFAHYLLTFSHTKQAIRLENPWANSGPLVFACSYRAKVECFVLKKVLNILWHCPFNTLMARCDKRQKCTLKGTVMCWHNRQLSPAVPGSG